MHRNWFITRTNREYVEYLSKALSISPVFAQVVLSRGIKTPEEVADFMSPTVDRLSDPFALEGVAKAVEVIREAARNGTKALVHGDYDVDGLTSTSIMVETLRSIGIETEYFIPERFTHGYGFHPDAVELARKSGMGLIVTVDCGISSFETAALARDAGIRVIITDHHEPVCDEAGVPQRPAADAVINPKLNPSDRMGLSGAGVAFKLSHALLGEKALRQLDLAAVGTIADMVPLTGENRIIAKQGLELMTNGARPGFQALSEVSGINGRGFKAGTLAYTVLPRINAPGRIARASEVVELLTTGSSETAIEIATMLNEMNSERQKIEAQVCQAARAAAKEKASDRAAVVIWGEGWHEGVIGIVASKLVDEFGKPAIVLSLTDGEAKGSGRSIPGFDLYAGLSGLSELLLEFGGHRQAAGMRIKASDLEMFERELCKCVENNIEEADPALHIDANVSLREINFTLVRELQTMEPHGYGNPAPLLGAKGLQVINPRVVGKNHLKMKLKDRSGVVDAIGFDMGDRMDSIEESLTIDAAFVPMINDWQGGRGLQLNIRALRPGGNQG